MALRVSCVCNQAPRIPAGQGGDVVRPCLLFAPPATRNSTGACATTTGSITTRSGERGRKSHDSYLRNTRIIGGTVKGVTSPSIMQT